MTLEKYLQSACTSSCGNDYDCPHVEQWFENEPEKRQIRIESILEENGMDIGNVQSDGDGDFIMVEGNRINL